MQAISVKDKTVRQVFKECLERGIEQGGRSLSRMGCAYRSSCGTRACFIGMLIPDDKYDFSFEDEDLRSLIKNGALNYVNLGGELWSFIDENLSSLENIQGFHDSNDASTFASMFNPIPLKRALEIVGKENEHLIYQWIETVKKDESK